jgi:hypothetical protein
MMMYKLACKDDPEKLGIKGEGGKWDIDKLIEHIDVCVKCRDYYTELYIGPGLGTYKPKK